MREQPDSGADTARARAVREANLVAGFAALVIAACFVLELVPGAVILFWTAGAALIAWALWKLVLRDLYLDWQIDREITRPLGVKTSTVAGWLKNRGRQRLDGRAPPTETPTNQITLKKP